MINMRAYLPSFNLSTEIIQLQITMCLLYYLPGTQEHARHLLIKHKSKLSSKDSYFIHKLLNNYILIKRVII